MLYYAQNDQEVSQIVDWVNDRLPDNNISDSEKYAVAVTSGTGLRSIFAGLVFFDYSGTDIFVAGAIDNPSVCRMKDFANAFDIPFRPPLNVLRITALVDTTNKRSLTFLTKLGFQKEGVIRNYLKEDNNGYVLGLTKQDWEDRYGQQGWVKLRTSKPGRDVRGASQIQ